MLEAPFIIAVCGGPQSGKSSLVDILKRKIPSSIPICHFKLSNFYKPLLGNGRRKRTFSSEYEEKMREG